MTGRPTYRSWAMMRARCQDANADQYRFYGALGIRVCDRWQSFENFFADMGVRPPGMTIDRIDGSKNYEPGNCRWLSHAEQCRNRKNNIIVEHDRRLMGP